VTHGSPSRDTIEKEVEMEEIASVLALAAQTKKKEEKVSSPVIEAWRELCRNLPSGLEWPDKRLVSHHIENYATMHEFVKTEEDLPCVYIGDLASCRTRQGEQNSGEYVHDPENDNCLCFASDGEIYEVSDVEGAWSNWQGSSTYYAYKWTDYEDIIHDSMFEEVLIKLRDALESYDRKLDETGKAGAKVAAAVTKALASKVED
jgi:hypothetical protein